MNDPLIVILQIAAGTSAGIAFVIAFSFVAEFLYRAWRDLILGLRIKRWAEDRHEHSLTALRKSGKLYDWTVFKETLKGCFPKVIDQERYNESVIAEKKKLDALRKGGDYGKA